MPSAPTGAVLDPLTGVLSWQPTETQLGDREFAVRVTDSRGSFSGQGFTVQVNGTNTPPAITSVPPTAAGVGQPYRYAVEATDPEGDALRFSLGERPEGMTVDELTGEVLWDAPTLGTHTVEIIASDSHNDLNRQRYTLVVEPTAVNQAPRITSTPQGLTGVGTEYTYTLEAEDPDGDTLNYQLLEAPEGMAVDAVTGEVLWDKPVAGTYTVAVGANDGRLGGAQRFTLTVVDNSPPRFTSEPIATAVVGGDYSYTVEALDIDGDALSYQLTEAPEGMSLDRFGRVQWQATDEGSFPVEVTVTDRFGATDVQSYRYLNKFQAQTKPKRAL
ncbi:Ig domain-containing protein [Baaleninema simplex]|uniref:Ig domain-containing protein n=1 Tax=Baaleninema simplex TaxID=2862350 RepID=UPI00034D6BAB|nr:Ig domain-containing protein [Baaleninema simplex]